MGGGNECESWRRVVFGGWGWCEMRSIVMWGLGLSMESRLCIEG